MNFTHSSEPTDTMVGREPHISPSVSAVYQPSLTAPTSVTITASSLPSPFVPRTAASFPSPFCPSRIRLHNHQCFQLHACLHRVCTLSHNLSRIMDLIPVEEVQIHFVFTSLRVTSVSAMDAGESMTKKLDPLMTFVYNMKSGAHSHRQAQVTSRVVECILSLQCCLQPALWLFGLPSLPLVW